MSWMQAALPAMPLVTVVMPVRNEDADIAECLRALQAQTYPAELLEVVVADGRSGDRTRDIVATFAAEDPRIRLIDNPSGTTPAGLNRAIAVARGSVIVRMDGHAAPGLDYVASCVRSLQSTRAWCVGGRMIKAGRTNTAEAVAAAAASRFGIGDSAFHYATTPRQVESVFLGCWPRDVFERVGLFDEELVRNQDDEFSYRIWRAGGFIWFDPSIAVVYRPRTTLGQVFEQHRQYGFWKVRVFQKHPGAMRWRHLVPGAFVFSLFLGLLGPKVRAAGLISFASGAAYAAASLTAALRIRATRPSLRLLDVVGAFAAMHLGYGIGLWQGIARWMLIAPLRRG